MNEDGLKVLPESIHDWDEVKNSENVGEFFDQVSNMRTKFGTALFKPGEDAGSESVMNFLNKAVELSDGALMPKPDLEDEGARTALFRSLGMPKEATDYEFEDIEGANHSDERKAFLGELAHKAGLTKSQLKSLDSELRKADFSVHTEMKEQQDTALKELKTEWGLAFDDRENQAKKVVESFFPQLKGIEMTAGDLTSFHSIAKAMGATATRELSDQGDQTPSLTPAEAAEKIDEIRSNAKHAYYNPAAKDHARAKARMRELYLVKNGMTPGSKAKGSGDKHPPSNAFAETGP